MSPSAGLAKVLVARNLKFLRLATKNVTKNINNFLFGARQTTQLQPIYARIVPRQPLHPATFIRQTKRWASTRADLTSAVRRFTSSTGKSGVRYDRSTFPTSRTASAVAASTGRAPFASTLRPNITGGALSRTAGGYGLGSGRVGGARYFSHGPATTGQVINNVSQAVRAFFISGQKVQYDGVNPRTGNKRYKVVGPVQEQTSQKLASVVQASPGAFIDFAVNPTITALTPLATIPGFAAQAKVQTRSLETLHTEGLLDILSIDFSRALKELSIIMNDLKTLAELGDLPITYQHSSLRVHFPGCDAETIERLALELGLRRGLVGQDAEFDAFVGSDMALLFPFAPSQTPSENSYYDETIDEDDHRQWYVDTKPFQLSHTSGCSTRSESGDFLHAINEKHSFSSPSGYDSLNSSELDSYRARPSVISDRQSPLEYSGIEGIYRFIEQCDAAARR